MKLRRKKIEIKHVCNTCRYLKRKQFLSNRGQVSRRKWICKEFGYLVEGSETEYVVKQQLNETPCSWWKDRKASWREKHRDFLLILFGALVGSIPKILEIIWYLIKVTCG